MSRFRTIQITLNENDLGYTKVSISGKNWKGGKWKPMKVSEIREHTLGKKVETLTEEIKKGLKELHSQGQLDASHQSETIQD